MSVKVLRWTIKWGCAIGVIAVLGACLAHQKRPLIKASVEADQLGKRVMEAIGAERWRALGRVVFEFRGLRYDWWVQRREVWVGDEPDRLILDLVNQRCRSEDDSKKVSETQCSYRLTRWNNDSFWLNPFVKIFDPGTERGLCRVEEDDPPWLCVHFGLGGDTPGDLYAIEIGPNDRPSAWRMWVKVLPIGGVHTAWRQWTLLPGGAWFAAERDAGVYTIPVEIIEVSPGGEEPVYH